jgi:hypothetical protein|tara:strand:- start:424 stop:717 length:294 start_codon:yes stop_codon:yes gene_type:complete
MFKHQAIYNTHESVISIVNDIPKDINGYVVTLNQSLVDTEEAVLQAAYDALEYSSLRKAKYDLLNQDEMRYDDIKNSTTTWIDAIDAIKAAHPKPAA